MDFTTTLLNPIASLTGGGAASAIITYFLTRNKAKTEVEYLELQIQKLKEEAKEYSKVSKTNIESTKPQRQIFSCVPRQAVIDTGVSFMRGMKQEAIMFGSDISWAIDYEDVITEATANSKKVVVIYEKTQASKVLRNADILLNAGATMIPIHQDSGIRGMLIDPEDSEDALLYIAYRKRKPGAAAVVEGERSSAEDYDYHARIYDMSHDSKIIRAIYCYYKILKRI